MIILLSYDTRILRKIGEQILNIIKKSADICLLIYFSTALYEHSAFFCLKRQLVAKIRVCNGYQLFCALSEGFAAEMCQAISVTT